MTADRAPPPNNPGLKLAQDMADKQLKRALDALTPTPAPAEEIDAIPPPMAVHGTGTATATHAPAAPDDAALVARLNNDGDDEDIPADVAANIIAAAARIEQLIKQRGLWELDARTAQANWHAACNDIEQQAERIKALTWTVAILMRDNHLASKDAERYRYLRDYCFDSFHDKQYPGYNFRCTVLLKPDERTPTLDAAIDAAIAASGKGEG